LQNAQSARNPDASWFEIESGDNLMISWWARPAPNDF